jgi:2-iminobutanoate/2-iminopropanoate deaminase
MKKVHTDKAPAAIGPYSQAIVYDHFVFTSGQIPLDPKTQAMKEGGIEEQTQQIMENLSSVLHAAGSSLDDVIKTTCFLADMSDFAAFNEVYSKYIQNAPARSCVAVKELPKGALAEVEVIAKKKK